MFRRREKRSPAEKAMGFLWPAMGWRRAISYTLHRLGRMPGSSYNIAAGFACGVAMSFTPFVGLHFVFSAVLAWIIRANIVASAIGTAIGNPWTFPFIWAWLYRTGRWLTGIGPLDGAPRLDFGDFFGDLLEATLTFDMDYMAVTAAPVFWPMLVASVPTAFVVWWAFYLPLRYLIQGYQERRQSNRNKGKAMTARENPR